MTDLSRIGLPASPALGIKAAAKVWIRKKKGNGSCFEEIEIASSDAMIFPARAGESGADRHKLLVHRRFAYELITRLTKIKGQGMLEKEDSNSLKKVLNKEGRDFYEWILQKGAQIGIRKYGVSVEIGSEANNKKHAPWLQITVTISDEALKELSTIHPIVS